MTGKHRILVVEDDGGIRELLASRPLDANLTFATCQSEAYEHLQRAEFDLVLLDLRLPRRPGDMKATKQVGIDILGQIRARGLRKRGSAMLLPVVVMTAYGSEALPVEVLVGAGANDYIPKPFGAEGVLEHKIQVALAGEGALVPASNIVGSTVRIAFGTDVVRIETLEYGGAHFGLLKALGELYVKDLKRLSTEEHFARLPGNRLAKQLGITEEALRKRVGKFRRKVSREFREGLGRALGRNDIIENRRDWVGYRLNPRVVRVVAWDHLAGAGTEK